MSLTQLFWRDMLLNGTTINVVAAFTGAILFARDAPTALAAAVYFSPLPYNLFLFGAVWRTAAAYRTRWSAPVQMAGSLWLVLVTLV